MWGGPMRDSWLTMERRIRESPQVAGAAEWGLIVICSGNKPKLGLQVLSPWKLQVRAVLSRAKCARGSKGF